MRVNGKGGGSTILIASSDGFCELIVSSVPRKPKLWLCLRQSTCLGSQPMDRRLQRYFDVHVPDLSKLLCKLVFARVTLLVTVVERTVSSDFFFVCVRMQYSHCFFVVVENAVSPLLF